MSTVDKSSTFLNNFYLLGILYLKNMYEKN